MTKIRAFNCPRASSPDSLREWLATAEAGDAIVYATGHANTGPADAARALYLAGKVVLTSQRDRITGDLFYLAVKTRAEEPPRFVAPSAIAQIPTWEACAKLGMTARQAAAARGVQLPAAQLAARKLKLKFAKEGSRG